jgi:hypothetical protein
VRDHSDIDEMEPPPARPVSLIDGLTDEQWARRRLRREARFRVVFGLVFGFAVALLASWHWMLFPARYVAAAGLVFLGSMLLFATLFARRRDDEAMEYAQWVAFTEWKFAQSLPWWLIASVAAIALVLAAVLCVVVVLAMLARGAG